MITIARIPINSIIIIASWTSSANLVPELVGGSADLTPSNLTKFKVFLWWTFLYIPTTIIIIIVRCQLVLNKLCELVPELVGG